MLELPPEMEERLEDAADILDEHDKFRILTHYDGDGISAAAVLSTALMKVKKGFHASFLHSFPDRLPEGLPLIFTDLGNADLEDILNSKMDEPVIVLDHHKVENGVDSQEGNVFINPHDYGIDGAREISGSTLAFLLAITFNEENWTETLYGLAGAAADKQNVDGGFIGPNKKILKAALEREVLKEREGLFIDGEDLEDSLKKAGDPYFPGISGREKEIEKLLEDVGLDPEISVEDIPSDKDRKLTSLLALSLLKKDIPSHVIESIRGAKYYQPQKEMDIDRLYKLLNACARTERQSLGLSLCLGDKSSLQEAVEIRKDYRREMIGCLKTLEEEGPEKKDNIQYFYEEKRERKGEVAGLGMLYFLEQDKPVFGLSEYSEDGKEKVDISARGTKKMIQKGVDLGKLCREVSSDFAGSGGGHDIAAGATVDKKDIEDFLTRMDDRIGEILG